MERKKKDKFGVQIEPMPRKQFLELMREFKKEGGKYMANEGSEAFLNAQGAEAVTLNETTILFGRRPSRSAVYEELYHVNSFEREGLTARSEMLLNVKLRQKNT